MHTVSHYNTQYYCFRFKYVHLLAYYYVFFFMYNFQPQIKIRRNVIICLYARVRINTVVKIFFSFSNSRTRQKYFNILKEIVFFMNIIS